MGVTNFILQLANECSQQLNKFNLLMEDSLQLPDDTQCINLQNLLSPQPQIKDSRQNTPPHSLAYSNSTCVKDKLGEIHMRSPLAFEPNAQMGQYSPTRTGYIKVNNENHPINSQKTLSNSPQRIEPEKIDSDRLRNRVKTQKRIKEDVQKKVEPNQKNSRNKSPSLGAKNQVQNQLKRQNEAKQTDCQKDQSRKNIAKGEAGKLSARVKELQQALHIETVLSEELRTKLSVTNKLLESKLKDNNIDFFLNLKNSSRDLRSIDIFIEMNTLQKAVTEKNIIIDRQKGQLRQANLEIQRLKQKKQPEKSPSRKLNEQIEKLVEQKQSLISYIDEQKATLKRKIDYIAQLEIEIYRMGDKQSHYTDIERPKLIDQLSDFKSENRKLNEELDAIKMEMNLIEINSKQQIDAHLHKNQLLEKTILHQQQEFQMLKKSPSSYIKQVKQYSVQKNDEQKQILIQQLDLLKDERDHYLNQYQKRTSESAKLYALQLKIATLQRSGQAA